LFDKKKLLEFIVLNFFYPILYWICKLRQLKKKQLNVSSSHLSYLGSWDPKYGGLRPSRANSWQDLYLQTNQNKMDRRCGLLCKSEVLSSNLSPTNNNNNCTKTNIFFGCHVSTDTNRKMKLTLFIQTTFFPLVFYTGWKLMY
jgi:hypothetical protein